ncbi:MAG: HEAT repeat domain-containing protein [Planctomycetota bacterium]
MAQSLGSGKSNQPVLVNAWDGAGHKHSGATISRKQRDDPWRHGYRPQVWRLVEAIQRYPLFSHDEPDWESLSRHEDAHVRAAAMLGIARAQDAKLTPLVVPLLHDRSRLVSKFALWALSKQEDPRIKGPVLEALRSWEDLEMRFIEQNFFGSHILKCEGLPLHLLGLSLRQRQDWLDNFDASRWDLTFKQHDLGPEWGADGRTEAIICFDKSVWNAGDQVKMRLRGHRPKSEKAVRTRIRGYGDWFAINALGEVADVGEYAQRRNVESDLFWLEPNECEQIEENLTAKRPLWPGIYLFRFRTYQANDCSYLARVQRSEAFEKTIPELLENLESVKSIEIAGQQRVKAAVPKLIELFRENGAKPDNRINFRIADALARICDPRAVPILLEYPFLQGSCLVGDTSGALKEFGTLAYPYYEQRILAWERTISGYFCAVANKPDGWEPEGHGAEELREIFGLEISLRLLGRSGSEEVNDSRLHMVLELARRLADKPYRKYAVVTVVLRAAVCAIAENHPEEAIEAIWVTRNTPETCCELLGGVREMSPAIAKPICVALWHSLQEEPQETTRVKSYLRKILSRLAPEALDEQIPLE